MEVSCLYEKKRMYYLTWLTKHVINPMYKCPSHAFGHCVSLLVLQTYSNHSVLFCTWPLRPLSAGHSKDVWEAFEAFHCSSVKRGKRTISQRWDELKPVKAPHFTSSPLDLHLESPLSRCLRDKLVFNRDLNFIVFVTQSHRICKGLFIPYL